MDLTSLPLIGNRSVLAPVAVLGALVLLAGICLAPRVRRYRALSKFPLHGAEYGSYTSREKAFRREAMKIYLSGYQKFRNAIHRLTTADGERIVLPPEYLEELRKRPDDEVNNVRALTKGLENRYTQIAKDEHDTFVARMVRADLTRNLARVTPVLSGEVDRTVKHLIPQTEEWSTVELEKRLLDVVATVSGCVFIGPDLCQRKEWLDASVNYTVNVFAAVRALKAWPMWFRPVGALLTPELKRVEKHRAECKAFLMPVIRDRRARMARGEKVPEDDMLQWMLAKGELEGVRDEQMSMHQLTLSMAAIHTTTRTLVQILFDLVAFPEVIPDLRREIAAAVAQHDGVMTTQALFQMKLLDSTMKESHRINPTGIERFTRYILKDITLTDGTQIPASSTIEVPYGAMTRDPTRFPQPEVFDPYRFYRLRKGEGPTPDGLPSTSNREQYQFVSITESDLGFGYGRHACPGRFFAANEIKLILARILLDYDVSLPEGVTGRYKNVEMGAASIPKPRATIRFRRARGEA